MKRSGANCAAWIQRFCVSQNDNLAVLGCFRVRHTTQLTLSAGIQQKVKGNAVCLHLHLIPPSFT